MRCIKWAINKTTVSLIQSIFYKNVISWFSQEINGNKYVTIRKSYTMSYNVALDLST